MVDALSGTFNLLENFRKYSKQLLDEKVIQLNEIENLEKEYSDELSEDLSDAKKEKNVVITPFMEEEWKGFQQLKDCFENVKTSLSETKLKSLAKFLYEFKEKDKLFKKTIKLLNDRKRMLENDSLDWSMGELLAYAGILNDGYNIRISGQDVERGTFSHRHAAIINQANGEEYLPLQNLDADQAEFWIYDSVLSEEAVLAFEYGYSTTSPKGLVIWEAQFGDFANGAQVLSLIHI